MVERYAWAIEIEICVMPQEGLTNNPGTDELMVAALGEAGRHARSAVGVAALPLGACVEVEGVFAVR